jgi:hypothetical protein
MARYYLSDGSTRFDLDIVSNLDVDLPSANWKKVNLAGEGSFIDGQGNYQGREISCSYNFKNNLENEREDFLDEFTDRIDDVKYIYKEVVKRIKVNLTNGSTIAILRGSAAQLSTGLNIFGIGIPDSIIEVINSTNMIISNAATATIANTELQSTTFLGRLKVTNFPSGGETYQNKTISENVKFTMLSESPYFTSTSVTSVAITSTGSAEFSTSVSINGRHVPATYEFTTDTTSTTWNLYQVKTSNFYGFRANASFGSSSIVEVQTTQSNLKLLVNDAEVLNAFPSSATPFLLKNGTNTLHIIATKGTLTVKYNERRL